MSAPLFLANNFIRRALEEKVFITPMKLQKLIYFTYRDFLQDCNGYLFAEPISAWKYGPVVESVYNHFSPFGAESISKFYKNSAEDVSILSESGPFGGILMRVWGLYRYRTGIQLSEITHREGSAWYKAWTSKQRYLNNEDIKIEQREY